MHKKVVWTYVLHDVKLTSWECSHWLEALQQLSKISRVAMCAVDVPAHVEYGRL